MDSVCLCSKMLAMLSTSNSALPFRKCRCTSPRPKLAFFCPAWCTSGTTCCLHLPSRLLQWDMGVASLIVVPQAGVWVEAGAK